ncbi:MAG: HD domain-containing protein [Candidatus Hodarchaeota archaeon]
MSLIEKAREVATRAHEGQTRKVGGIPYITHPEAVYKLLVDVGIKDEDILAAAWLHDTIEDCDFKREQIEREFNANVARIVQALSRDGKSREKRAEYNETIKNSDFAVQIVKLADTIHNCQTLDEKLKRITIQRKVDDCESVFLDLAREICPKFHELLEACIKPWLNKYPPSKKE